MLADEVEREKSRAKIGMWAAGVRWSFREKGEGGYIPRRGDGRVVEDDVDMTGVAVKEENGGEKGEGEMDDDEVECLIAGLIYKVRFSSYFFCLRFAIRPSLILNSVFVPQHPPLSPPQHLTLIKSKSPKPFRNPPINSTKKTGSHQRLHIPGPRHHRPQPQKRRFSRHRHLNNPLPPPSAPFSSPTPVVLSRVRYPKGNISQ